MPTYPSEHALPKSIAVFGAGPGLGQAVARHYAREGYAVTLVGRRSEPLDRLAKDLTSAGATAHVITADLSDTGATPRLAEQIRAKAGHLDAFYYAPTPDTGFVSAANLTPQHAQKFMPLIFYTMLALVQEFLPHMLEQGDGAILTAQGGSTVHGLPNMSGPSPAQAAQRNYLQALHAEVAEKGVYVGHRWNIGVVKAAAMEHWCRCGPGRGGAAEVCGAAGVCGASQARGGEPGGAMMHPRSRAWWHPDPIEQVERTINQVARPWKHGRKPHRDKCPQWQALLVQGSGLSDGAVWHGSAHWAVVLSPFGISMSGPIRRP